jgi:hypothetical protein
MVTTLRELSARAASLWWLCLPPPQKHERDSRDSVRRHK